MTFLNLAQVAQQVFSFKPKVPFRYRPRNCLARPGTPLWPRSKEKWGRTEYWDSPLKALARRFASSPLAPLTKCERAIMRELADKCNRKLKYAFCGLQHLIVVTKFSRRGIQNALQNLERKGFLVIDRSQTKYRTSMYYLMFDTMEKVLSGTPLLPSESPKKRLNFVAKIQKVHPNIGININTLSTLRSKQNAFEKSQAEDITPRGLSLQIFPYDDDARYKKVVTLIQRDALRHGGSQKDLLSRYYEIAGNSSLNDELKENLHHNEQLIVKAVIFLLLQLRSATSYISGTLNEVIKTMDGSNVSSA